MSGQIYSPRAAAAAAQWASHDGTLGCSPNPCYSQPVSRQANPAGAPRELSSSPSDLLAKVGQDTGRVPLSEMMKSSSVGALPPVYGLSVPPSQPNSGPPGMNLHQQLHASSAGNLLQPTKSSSQGSYHSAGKGSSGKMASEISPTNSLGMNIPLPGQMGVPTRLSSNETLPGSGGSTARSDAVGGSLTQVSSGNLAAIGRVPLNPEYGELRNFSSQILGQNTSSHPSFQEMSLTASHENSHETSGDASQLGRHGSNLALVPGDGSSRALPMGDGSWRSLDASQNQDGSLRALPMGEGSMRLQSGSMHFDAASMLPEGSMKITGESFRLQSQSVIKRVPVVPVPRMEKQDSARQASVRNLLSSRQTRKTKTHDGVSAGQIFADNRFSESFGMLSGEALDRHAAALAEESTDSRGNAHSRKESEVAASRKESEVYTDNVRKLSSTSAGKEGGEEPAAAPAETMKGTRVMMLGHRSLKPPSATSMVKGKNTKGSSSSLIGSSQSLAGLLVSGASRFSFISRTVSTNTTSSKGSQRSLSERALSARQMSMGKFEMGDGQVVYESALHALADACAACAPARATAGGAYIKPRQVNRPSPTEVGRLDFNKPVKHLDQLFAQARALDPVLKEKVQDLALRSAGLFPLERRLKHFAVVKSKPVSEQGQYELPEFVLWSDALRDPILSRRIKWGGVKNPSRAIEKSLRSYHASVSDLLDLCRKSIYFEHMHDLTQCVKTITNHPDLVVERVKNRLDINYDAELSAGYRDVALNLRVVTPRTVAMGVETHICELQLILIEFAMLKHDAGHKRYVNFRNSLGE